MLFPLVQMFHQDANLRRTCACSEPFCLDMQFFFNLKVENGWKNAENGWEWHLSQTWIMSFTKGTSIGSREFCRTCLGNWTYSRGETVRTLFRNTGVCWIIFCMSQRMSVQLRSEKRERERHSVWFSDIPIIGRTFTNNFDKMLVQLISPKCQDMSGPFCARQLSPEPVLKWESLHHFFCRPIAVPNVACKKFIGRWLQLTDKRLSCSLPTVILSYSVNEVSQLPSRG